VYKRQVIALAIFVGVGLSVSTAVRSAINAAVDLRDRATAEDIARSAIAQIRAGIADADTLDGPVPLDEHTGATQFEDTPQDSPWTREIDTERSGFTNLTRLTITVRHDTRPAATVTIQTLIPDNARQADTLAKAQQPSGSGGVTP